MDCRGPTGSWLLNNISYLSYFTFLICGSIVYISGAAKKKLKQLKRHNQAKIIRTSVFLLWLLNMAIRCEHVHRLELRKFLKFCVAHLPASVKS